MIFANIDPNLFLAVIGIPLGVLSVAGVTWYVRKPQKGSAFYPDREDAPAKPQLNGNRYITPEELRIVISDLRQDLQADIRAARDDMNARFDLLVQLIKTNGRG